MSGAMVHDLGDSPRPVLDALAAAERVLSRRAGAGIVLADPEDLGGSDRSVVARARSGDPAAFVETGTSSEADQHPYGTGPPCAVSVVV